MLTDANLNLMQRIEVVLNEVKWNCKIWAWKILCHIDYVQSRFFTPQVNE